MNFGRRRREQPPPQQQQQQHHHHEQHDGFSVDAYIQQFFHSTEQLFGGGAEPQVHIQDTTAAATPPAAPHIRRQLPVVRVRPEDLVDNSHECCICLLDMTTTVTRLPCAHVFHTECIQDWLAQNCACPICRYELETLDEAFEQGRWERMRHRRPRMARYELERLSTRDLRALVTTRRREIPRSIVDREELIEFIVKEGIVDLIPLTPPSLSFRIQELRDMSVRDLRRVMNEEAGVFFDARDVVEKEDMIAIFIASGRMQLVVDDDEEPIVIAHVETVNSEEDDDEVEDVIAEVTRVNPGLIMEENSEFMENPAAAESSNRDRDRTGMEASAAAARVGLDGADFNEHTLDVDDSADTIDSTTIFEQCEASMLSNEEMQELVTHLQHRVTAPSPSVQGILEQCQLHLDDFEVGRLVDRLRANLCARVSESYRTRHVQTLDHRVSISQLRRIARERSIDLRGCLERSEMVDRILGEDYLSAQLFAQWTRADLQRLVHAVGITPATPTTRAMLVQQLQQAALTDTTVAAYLRTLAPLAVLTLEQLRVVARLHGIEAQNNENKFELLHRLVQQQQRQER